MLEALINYFPIKESGFAGVGALDYSIEERKKLALLSRKSSCEICGPLLKILPDEENKNTSNEEMNSKEKIENEEIKNENSENDKKIDNDKEAKEIFEYYEKKVQQLNEFKAALKNKENSNINKINDSNKNLQNNNFEMEIDNKSDNIAKISFDSGIFFLN